MNIESIQNEIEQIEPPVDEQQESKQESKSTGQAVQIIRMIYNMGNDVLKKKHEKLAFTEEELNQNAEMLSAVIDKHFDISQLEASPEFLFIAHSAMMYGVFTMRLNDLEKSQPKQKENAEE